jgi:putative acetyltransferase
MHLEIRQAELSDDRVRTFLEEHLQEMHRTTPSGSVRALDPGGLHAPEVTVWSVWSDGSVVGCGALKELDPKHGETKSLHTAGPFRGAGVATRLLEHLIAESRSRGYRALSLQTGASPAFEPTRSLYARFGFQPCGAFGEYPNDPHSFFMTLAV